MRCLSLIFAIVVCHINSVAQQIINNPVFDRTDVPTFHINKVEISEGNTYIYCTYSAEAASWANISPNTYLEDVVTGKRYTIIKSEGIPFAPHIRSFISAEECQVKFSFPLIPSGSKFNLIESSGGKAVNIFGINLKECNDSIYKNYSIEQANAFNSKADFYYSAKNYEKAIEYEEHAMNIYKFWLGKHDEHYDHTIFMLSIYYNMIGKNDLSSKYIKESTEIRRIMFGEENISYLTSLVTYARDCIANGNVMEGISLLEKGLNIGRKILQTSEWQYYSTLIALAQAYEKISDITKALQYAEEAYSILKNGENYNDEFLNTAYLCVSLNQYVNTKKAEELLTDIYSIVKQKYGMDNKYYMDFLFNMTNHAILQMKSTEALLYAQEAKEISEKLYGKNSFEYSVSLDLLYQINSILLHDYKEAIKYKLESLEIKKNEKDLIFYANELGYLADDYANIKDYKNALHYTNIAINTIKETIQDFEKGTIDQKYSLWSKLYRSVFSAYPLYVANLREKHEEGNLYNNMLFFKGITSKNHKSCSWNDIQKSLGNKDIAVEFVESIEKDSIHCYYALTIKKGDKAPKLYRLFDLLDFEKIFQSTLSFRGHCRMLGEKIWDTIKNELVDIENIYFSPAGICQSIFIENLPYNDNEYYSDKYNMYRLSSTSVLIQEREHAKFKKAVLYGGLNYSNSLESEKLNSENINRCGFDYLYNTEEEVNSISSILNYYGIENTLYSGDEGTEKRFRSLSGQEFNILHIATHGMHIKEENVESMKSKNNYSFLLHSSIDKLVYPSDALSWSFMVLSDGNNLVNRDANIVDDNDGILTALEVADMDFHNIDLVVLSACESGLGVTSTDHLKLGFQRGFKDAGANTILMTLNNVDDEATKILMVEFYKNLLSGKSKCQSLKDAQRYLRKVDNGKYDILKYWASFVLLDGLN